MQGCEIRVPLDIGAEGRPGRILERSCVGGGITLPGMTLRCVQSLPEHCPSCARADRPPFGVNQDFPDPEGPLQTPEFQQPANLYASSCHRRWSLLGFMPDCAVLYSLKCQSLWQFLHPDIRTPSPFCRSQAGLACPAEASDLRPRSTASLGPPGGLIESKPDSDTHVVS
jgi:hypothetical protein